MDISDKEIKLKNKLNDLQKMEEEIKQRELLLKKKENAKKQVLLRLSPTLWDEIAAWAEDDFRSINSQIEYLLNESVKSRRKS